MILDHPLVSRQVFYPRPTDVPPTLVVEADGARLGCHVHRPHPDAGTLLHFHGNGELAAEYARDWPGLFTGMGVNVCFAEYRGYGASTGTPALGAMLGDGERIVHALGVPPDRLVVFGRSLGTLYAIELARRLPGIAGLILESGIADVLELWPPAEALALIGIDPAAVRAEVAAHFDHRAKLGAYAGPLLVLHAAGDHLLPPSHADRLYAWAAGADKRLVVFPRGDHNTIFPANVVQYVAEVREFLRRTGVAG